MKKLHLVQNIFMSEDQQLTKRARRTIRDIQQAAWDLISQRDPDQISVDDIAEKAQISRRTFFNYFPSKNQVYLLKFKIPESALERFMRGDETNLLAAMVDLAAARMRKNIQETPNCVDIFCRLFKSDEIWRAVFAEQKRAEDTLREVIARRLGTDPAAAQTCLLAELVFVIERSIVRDHLMKGRDLEEARRRVLADYRQIAGWLGGPLDPRPENQGAPTQHTDPAQHADPTQHVDPTRHVAPPPKADSPQRNNPAALKPN